MPTENNKTELLKNIKDEIINGDNLPLYKERVKNKNFPVIGEGNHDAQIMLVGEAPGRNEAATGRPFCGAAGKILDELLESAGIKRQDVYVTNVVKDRPSFNRDPLPAEIQAYGPFLDRQVNIIRPKIIATLGRFSMQYIMEKFGLAAHLKSISQIHGQTFVANTTFGEVKIIPLYHPAVAVYNTNMKEVLKKDFQILREVNK